MNTPNPENEHARPEDEKIKDMESSLDRLQNGLDSLREQLKDIQALIDAAKKKASRKKDPEEGDSLDFAIAI